MGGDLTKIWCKNGTDLTLTYTGGFTRKDHVYEGLIKSRYTLERVRGFQGRAAWQNLLFIH
jgi:hypothetical protein